MWVSTILCLLAASCWALPADVRNPDCTDEKCCMAEPDKGSCRAAIRKFYYNNNTGECEDFNYGGCNGNDNNYETKEVCLLQCGHLLTKNDSSSDESSSDESFEPTAVPDNASSEQDICLLPPEEIRAARCLALIDKWTFNSGANQCEQYVYGGCGGTANLFDTEDECVRQCGKKARRSGKAVCSMEIKTGDCRAFKEKYAFNSKANRCEGFIYTGCGGNENNFESAEECRKTCGGDEPSTDTQCDTKSCPWYTYQHYQEIGCKPNFDDGACCPTSYDCSHLSDRSNSKCYYRGQEYNVSDPMPEIMERKPCLVHCTCRELYPGEVAPNCVSVECPEFFGHPREKSHCKRIYSPDKCCAVGHVCPEDATTPSSEPTPEPIVCEYNGATYTEGQTFDRADNDCISCTCKAGFNNETLEEPFCKPIECGFEIHYAERIRNGCSPVYLENRCCAIDWECPEVPPRPTPTPNSALEQSTPEPNLEDFTRPPPNNETDICNLDMEAGPCEAYIPSFYYDSVEQTCKGFVYGGCGGNANRFKTLDACNETCNTQSVSDDKTDICTLDMEQGPCEYYIPNYYYDSVEQTCKAFAFSGCGGTANRFETLDECNEACNNQSVSACKLPGVETSCDTGPNYYFDHLSGKCSRFESGCGANANNFKSMEQCQRQCKELNEIDNTLEQYFRKADDNKPCQLPAQVGPCRAMKPRFYYDPNDNTCKDFIYGGCRGNENNFRTREKCIEKCGIHAETNVTLRDIDICQLPAKSGMCKAKIIRFYYDNKVKECRTFIYGGCQGNANNFHTLEACQKRCRSQDSDNSNSSSSSSESNSIEDTNCSLPQAMGHCSGALHRYYYNVVVGTCEPFVYTGCGGNENNFKSLRECHKKCEVKIERRAGDVCKQPVNSGPCYGAFHRFYFDYEHKVCRHFIYGGCRGNGNNFNSLKECEAMCAKPVAIEIDLGQDWASTCQLPPKTGPCFGYIPRYFYDPVTSSCKHFYYGGCGGNGNNFFTHDECILKCTHVGIDTHEAPSGYSKKPTTCFHGTTQLGIGEQLAITDNKCVTCTCLTPPRLTCIKKRCPQPPSDAKCDISYTDNECCPSYSCLPMNPPVRMASCADIACEESQICVMIGDNPTCIATSSSTESSEVSTAALHYKSSSTTITSTSTSTSTESST